MSHVYKPSVYAISSIPTIGRFLAQKWFPSDIRLPSDRIIVRVRMMVLPKIMAVSWYLASFAYLLGSKIADVVAKRLSLTIRRNTPPTNNSSITSGSWWNPGKLANLWGLKTVCKWLIDNG